MALTKGQNQYAKEGFAQVQYQQQPQEVIIPSRVSPSGLLQTGLIQREIQCFKSLAKSCEESLKDLNSK